MRPPSSAPDLLHRATRALAACSGADQLLDTLAAAVVAELGGWALADRLDEPDLVTRVSVHGPDGPVPPVSGRPEPRRSSARALGLLAQLDEAPHRTLRLSPVDLTALAGSPDPRLRAQGALAQQMGASDLLVLGLPGADTLLGVLTVASTGERFSDDHVAQLGDVAVLAGLALDRLRLRQVQRSVSTALQTRLLPPLPLLPGLTLAARYLPAGKGLDVGGDWYDAFVLPDGTVALAIGDATGHDIDAAARMAELRNLLRGAAVSRQDPPGATLSRLDAVTAHLGSDASATCVYAQLRSRPAGAWHLTWSNAGHLPPLLLRDGRAELLDTPPDLMLGVEPATDRGDHARDLLPGDLLVLCTDGLVEDRREPLGQRLDRLVQVLQAAPGAEPETVADVLLTEMASREDDVALLVVLIGPAAPAAGSAAFFR